jgi:hypothetical protein
MAGALAPLAWPWLHPVPAALLPADWIGGLADGAAGAGAGAVLGWLARPAVGRRSAAGFSLALVGTGLFLGWQSVTVLAVASVVVQSLARGGQWLLARVSSGGPAAATAALSHPTLWLWVAAMSWVLAWRVLVSSGIGRLWIGWP